MNYMYDWKKITSCTISCFSFSCHFHHSFFVTLRNAAVCTFSRSRSRGGPNFEQKRLSDRLKGQCTTFDQLLKEAKGKLEVAMSTEEFIDGADGGGKQLDCILFVVFCTQTLGGQSLAVTVLASYGVDGNIGNILSSQSLRVTDRCLLSCM